MFLKLKKAKKANINDVLTLIKSISVCFRDNNTYVST